MQTLSYTGSADDNPSRVIAHRVRDNGESVAEPLEHKIRRHSPGGFSWGYAGSGPAELALNMLADALGQAATCDLCFGSGLSGTVDLKDNYPIGTESPCPFCDRTGLAPVVLRNYQAFKASYVANFVDEWSLTRAEIVHWAAGAEADRVRDEIIRLAELPTPLSMVL